METVLVAFQDLHVGVVVVKCYPTVVHTVVTVVGGDVVVVVPATAATVVGTVVGTVVVDATVVTTVVRTGESSHATDMKYDQ